MSLATTFALFLLGSMEPQELFQAPVMAGREGEFWWTTLSQPGENWLGKSPKYH